MRNSIQIIPAILATTEKEYQDKLRKIEESGLFDGNWIQIDLMDNKFVQNKSIGPEIMAKYPNNFQIEAHLMVDYPESWIDELIKVRVERVILPVEDEEGILEKIIHLKNHQVQIGLAFNPQTPVAKVEPFADKIDVVLLLAVQPGFGGQKFISATLEKVREASLSGWKNRRILIEVDGGINEEVAPALLKAGADILVIGEHLINGNIAENLEKLKQSLRS